LGNLFKVETPLLLRNSLKVDALRIGLLERDFSISQFQNPKLTTTEHHMFYSLKSVTLSDGKFLKVAKGNYLLP